MVKSIRPYWRRRIRWCAFAAPVIGVTTSVALAVACAFLSTVTARSIRVVPPGEHNDALRSEADRAGLQLEPGHRVGAAELHFAGFGLSARLAEVSQALTTHSGSLSGGCIFHWQVGWFMRSLRSRGVMHYGAVPEWTDTLYVTERVVNVGGHSIWRPIPGEPLWLGLFVNALAASVIALGCLAMSYAVRWELRLRRDRCVHCRHQLHGMIRCPECGLQHDIGPVLPRHG